MTSNPISSASQTISSQLTGTDSYVSSIFPRDCAVSNLNAILYVSIILVLVCISMSLISQITNNDTQLEYDEVPMRHRRSCGCKKCQMENFSNDEIFAYSKAESANFQSIPLTSSNESLVFGQANRRVNVNNDDTTFTIDIFANLYVLDGNPFPKEDKPVHSYKAFLSKSNKIVELGTLTKDGDGLYKLKYTETKNVSELVQLTTLSVFYEKNGKQELLISGKFN